MSDPPVAGDKRQPCRHCGELRRPRGLLLHERACPRNPERAPSASAAAPAPGPAPAPPVVAIPPRSPQAQIALDILGRARDPYLVRSACKAYLRARAADFGILEAR